MESVRQNLNSPLALFILLRLLKVKRLVPISGSGGDRTQSADTKMQPDSGRVYWTCVSFPSSCSSSRSIDSVDCTAYKASRVTSSSVSWLSVTTLL